MIKDSNECVLSTRAEISDYRNYCFWSCHRSNTSQLHLPQESSLYIKLVGRLPSTLNSTRKRTRNFQSVLGVNFSVYWDDTCHGLNQVNYLIYSTSYFYHLISRLFTKLVYVLVCTSKVLVSFVALTNMITSYLVHIYIPETTDPSKQLVKKDN